MEKSNETAIYEREKCSSCITNIIKKIIWVVIGSTIAAFGIDLAKKHSWQIKYVRIALDVIVVLLGMLLGGKVGMCTICTILLSGVMIQKNIAIIAYYDRPIIYWNRLNLS